MSYPSEYKYTKEHEWIKIDGNSALVGVTQYAVEQLGDVVYLDLPKVGTTFKANETFGTIESTKTVSDLYMPTACKVLEVNKSIVDAPEILAQDAHEKGWLLKVELDGKIDGLLSAEEYEKFIKGGN